MVFVSNSSKNTFSILFDKKHTLQDNKTLEILEIFKGSAINSPLEQQVIEHILQAAKNNEIKEKETRKVVLDLAVARMQSKQIPSFIASILVSFSLSEEEMCELWLKRCVPIMREYISSMDIFNLTARMQLCGTCELVSLLSPNPQFSPHLLVFIPFLLQILSSSSGEILLHTICALTSFSRSRNTILAERMDNYITALLPHFLDRDAKVRHAAANALSSLLPLEIECDKHSDKLLEGVLTLLRDPVDEVVIATLEGLQAIIDDPLPVSLLKFLPFLLSSSIDVLGRIVDSRTREPLTDFLEELHSSLNPKVVELEMHTVDFLMMSPMNYLVHAVKEKLKQSKQRHGVAGAIATLRLLTQFFPDNNKTDNIIQTLISHRAYPCPSVRLAVVEGLGWCINGPTPCCSPQAPYVINTLLLLVKDPNASVSMYACACLRNIAGSRTTKDMAPFIGTIISNLTKVARGYIHPKKYIYSTLLAMSGHNEGMEDTRSWQILVEEIWKEDGIFMLHSLVSSGSVAALVPMSSIMENSSVLIWKICASFVDYMDLLLNLNFSEKVLDLLEWFSVGLSVTSCYPVVAADTIISAPNTYNFLYKLIQTSSLETTSILLVGYFSDHHTTTIAMALSFVPLLLKYIKDDRVGLAAIKTLQTIIKRAGILIRDYEEAITNKLIKMLATVNSLPHNHTILLSNQTLDEEILRLEDWPVSVMAAKALGLLALHRPKYLADRAQEFLPSWVKAATMLELENVLVPMRGMMRVVEIVQKKNGPTTRELVEAVRYLHFLRGSLEPRKAARIITFLVFYNII